jgi:hypothetical protein
MKSAKVSGPMGWFMPSFITVSIAPGVPTPSMTAKIASLIIGISTRLAMNPGRSADSTAVLPSAVQSSNAVFIDASDVAALRMISTSTMSGTGFMKCMPRTLSGRVVAAPSVAIGMEDVFDARITYGHAILYS